MRDAFHRVTAKDTRGFNHDRAAAVMARSLVEASICSSNLCEGVGKFWDSSSDSECEDLGDADILAARANGDHPVPQLVSTTLVAMRPSSCVATVLKPQGKSPTPPKRVRAPLRRPWKGPLPPRRTSSEITLGDLIRPVLDRDRPPKTTGFQISEDLAAFGGHGFSKQPRPTLSGPVGQRPSLVARSSDSRSRDSPDAQLEASPKDPSCAQSETRPRR